jgi:hypothetical protein
MIAGGTGNRIENCVFVGNLSSTLENNHSGIWLTGDTGTVIKNNKISNFLNNGAYHHNAPGIMFYQTTSAIIENNEIENCGSGVFVKGWDNDSITIRLNLIVGCGSGVKMMTTINTHKVYQNIVIGRSGGSPGLACHPGIDNGLRGTIYFTNNTLINSYINFTYSISSTANVYSHNNITAYLSGSSYGFEAAYWDRLNQIFNDYNNYYNVASWYTYNNQQHTTLSSFRSALGGCPGDSNDCSSTIDNPLFSDASAGNYKLQSGSPARTLGRTITAIHGSSGETIPAGAYITGNEVIGISSGPDTTAPTVTIQNPTAAATYLTNQQFIDLSGSASDNIGVTGVVWANDRGGSGSCTGTTSWACNNIQMYAGTNVVTITASDAIPNNGTDVLTVTYDATPPVLSSPSPNSELECSTNPRSVTLQISSNETATARMSPTDMAYASMTDTFTNTNSTTHSESKTLACGASYTYYVRAQDTAGNVNTSSTLIDFSIAPEYAVRRQVGDTKIIGGFLK